jgi:hypothetical protein
MNHTMGGTWIHQRSGGLYRVEGIYVLESDGRDMVAYTSLGSKSYWVRPLVEWHELVLVDRAAMRYGPRFVLQDPDRA